MASPALTITLKMIVRSAYSADQKLEDTHTFTLKQWEMVAFVLAPSPRYYLSPTNNNFLHYFYAKSHSQLSASSHIVIARTAINNFITLIAPFREEHYLDTRLNERLAPATLKKYFKNVSATTSQDKQEIRTEINGLIAAYLQAQTQDKEIELIYSNHGQHE